MLEELYQTYLTCSGVSTDTRAIERGNIYFALKGPSFNGNLFASQAIEAGAIAVVVDEDVEVPENALVFQTIDVLTTLQDLARHHRTQCSNTTFIGLTGSNGKTTAKELMKSVLSTSYRTHATFGNLNNHIGVPLTLLRMPVDTEVAIIEMGANHRGEIELLSGISLPNYGYITNFGKAHLEGFGGIEGVIKGKSELYARMKEINGTCIVNGMDELQLAQSSECNRIVYGSKQSEYPMEYSEVNYPAQVRFNGNDYCSQLTGSFHTANIGAAIAIGKILGVSEANIALGIHSYAPENNRSQWTKTSTNRVMLDAYNANPSSMLASLKSFIDEAATPRIVIIGDMFELGEASAEEHQLIVDYLKQKEGTNAILVGELFSATDHESMLSFTTTERCENYLKENPITNSSILLKGSRGMHLETLYPYL